MATLVVHKNLGRETNQCDECTLQRDVAIELTLARCFVDELYDKITVWGDGSILGFLGKFIRLAFMLKLSDRRRWNEVWICWIQ
jgi:hypothetical protein